MTNFRVAVSPQVYARVIGSLYLVTIASGIIAQTVISNRLVVEGDAITTAANILAHKDVFQSGFTLYLVEMTCQIAQVSLFYILLKPAGRNLALLALVFSLIGCTIKVISRLFYVAPLLVLEGSGYLSAFNVEELQALTLFLVNVNGLAAGIALPFFGISAIMNGYLIIQSTFLPRFLGVLSMVGGLGWVTFLSPSLGNQSFPYILPVALIGSLSQILWLFIKGVNVEQWKKLATEYVW